MELKKAGIDAYETSGEVTLAQEETAETIVPDYCPDVARVIESDGTVYLHNRDNGELAGTVRVTVLYTPEGESGIRSLEFSMPFNVDSGNPALSGCQAVAAEAEPEFLETRMLNPRKLFTHCKIVIRLTGYRKAPLSFSTDVEDGESVEKRREKQHAVVPVRIAERDFTFTDEWNISPGRPGAAELLSSRVQPTVNETRVIGSKLILKGIFTLSLLYNTEEGTCCSASGELPFSQIMDVEGAPEDAIVSAQVRLTGEDIQIDGGDPEGRQIGVALYLHAFAIVRQERELELLTDLYSTACEVRLESAPLDIAALYDRQTRRQIVRETLETGAVADSILSLRVDCGTVSANREGEGIVLRTVADIRVLYRDEGGVPLVAQRRVDVSCETDFPEGVQARAVCPEEPQGSVGERGIEVRFPVDFQIEAVTVVRKAGITSAELDTSAPKDTAAAPSLVLRRMGRDETAWDLAKRCNSTIAGILEANRLAEEEDIPRETLILIPRKRA